MNPINKLLPSTDSIGKKTFSAIVTAPCKEINFSNQVNNQLDLKRTKEAGGSTQSGYETANNPGNNDSKNHRLVIANGNIDDNFNNLQDKEEDLSATLREQTTMQTIINVPTSNLQESQDKLEKELQQRKNTATSDTDIISEAAKKYYDELHELSEIYCKDSDLGQSIISPYHNKSMGDDRVIAPIINDQEKSIAAKKTLLSTELESEKSLSAKLSAEIGIKKSLSLKTAPLLNDHKVAIGTSDKSTGSADGSSIAANSTDFYSEAANQEDTVTKQFPSKATNTITLAKSTAKKPRFLHNDESLKGFTAKNIKRSAAAPATAMVTQFLSGANNKEKFSGTILGDAIIPNKQLFSNPLSSSGQSLLLPASPSSHSSTTNAKLINGRLPVNELIEQVNTDSDHLDLDINNPDLTKGKGSSSLSIENPNNNLQTSRLSDDLLIFTQATPKLSITRSVIKDKVIVEFSNNTNISNHGAKPHEMAFSEIQEFRGFQDEPKLAANLSKIAHEQINVAIRYGATKNKNEIIINMYPKALGTVEVKLDFATLGNNNSQTLQKIKISTDNPETLELLQNAETELRKAISEINKNTDSTMEFDLMAKNHENKNDDSNHDHEHRNQSFGGGGKHLFDDQSPKHWLQQPDDTNKLLHISRELELTKSALLQLAEISQEELMTSSKQHIERVDIIL